MSLKDFVKGPEARKRLEPLTPLFTRSFEATLRVPPKSKDPGGVGAAFDYALRIELTRRAPHAQTFRWIAEETSDRTRERLDTMANRTAQRRNEGLVRRMDAVVAAARALEADRVPAASSTPVDLRRSIARSSLCLAKLDLWIRTPYTDETFDRVDDDAVDEVASLIEVTRLEDFLHPEVLVLNPAFGKHARRVGGADADLVSGDRLIDLKTTRNRAVEGDDVRQLIGYLLLADTCRREDPSSFPEVRRLSLYFARFRRFVDFDATWIRSRPGFSAAREWLVGPQRGRARPTRG